MQILNLWDTKRLSLISTYVGSQTDCLGKISKLKKETFGLIVSEVKGTQILWGLEYHLTFWPWIGEELF